MITDDQVRTQTRLTVTQAQWPPPRWHWRQADHRTVGLSQDMRPLPLSAAPGGGRPAGGPGAAGPRQGHGTVTAAASVTLTESLVASHGELDLVTQA